MKTANRPLLGLSLRSCSLIHSRTLMGSSDICLFHLQEVGVVSVRVDTVLAARGIREREKTSLSAVWKVARPNGASSEILSRRYSFI